MHITLETDYAIRIVDRLARNGGRMSAQSLSEQNGVTLRFSLKILSKLAGSGIVRSYKGAQGGYEIAKPLEDISVNDVLETIEGPYRFSRCLREDHTCSRNMDGECRYHRLFCRISEQVSSQLRDVTFADIIVGE